MADQHPKDNSSSEGKDVIPLQQQSLSFPFESLDLVPVLPDQPQIESDTLRWTDIISVDSYHPSSDNVPDHTLSLPQGPLEDDWIDMIGLEDDSSSAKIVTTSLMNLSREELSPYFRMPITQAADELKVGLTTLKRHCRNLGISRWPHRKFKSLRYLSDNVQVLNQTSGGEAELNSRETTQLLENEQKKLEEDPNFELDQNTNRLRNRFYKATYKKRRKMGEGSSTTSTLEVDEEDTLALCSSAPNANPPSHEATDDDEEQGKMKSKPISDLYK